MTAAFGNTTGTTTPLSTETHPGGLAEAPDLIPDHDFHVGLESYDMIMPERRPFSLEAARKLLEMVNNNQTTDRETQIYLNRIPAHLINRSMQARISAGTTDIESTEEVDDLGVQIDIDTAELCNLDAVAVRRALIARLDIPDKIKRNQYFLNDKDPRRSIFKELVYEDGLFKQRSYSDTKRPRVQTVLQAVSVYQNIVAWTDLETEDSKPKLRKMRTVPKTKPEDTDHLPITIGLSTQYGDIPLVKSIKSMTQCHVVMPDGQELEVSKYNKQKLLGILSEIVCDKEPYLRQLVKELQGNDPSLNQPLFTLAEKFITEKDNISSADHDVRLKELIAELVMTNAAYTYVRTDPASPDKTAIWTVAWTIPDSFDITVNGSKKHGSRKLGWNKFIDPQTSLEVSELTLYAGLDENYYGAENTIAYRQFVYQTDGVNPSRLYKYGISGIPEAADAKDMAQFIRQLRTLAYMHKDAGTNMPFPKMINV